ncbi:MAG: class I SAM-dependent methyltransferase [Microthrixaceae bacterium]
MPSQDTATDGTFQQSTARDSYNRMSRVYGLLSDSSEKRFVHDAIDGLLKPAEGEVVLEAGFGTGQALVALAELVGPSGTVCGIDISDGMVQHTADRVESAGLSERVELVRGSATELPWPDGHFDAAFMSFTLELFSDDEIPVVLAEVKRVLCPGGRLCVACMSTHGGVKAMEELYGWSHRHFPSFVDCRPIDGTAAVAKAGFDITESRDLSMWGLAVELLLASPAG